MSTPTTAARPAVQQPRRTHTRAVLPSQPTASLRRACLSTLSSLPRSRATAQVAARLAGRARAVRTVAAIATEKVDPSTLDLTDTLNNVRGNTGGAVMMLEDATITIGNNDLMVGV
jgi:hypothetical protein